jgi:dephospho-CoA kinase
VKRRARTSADERPPRRRAAVLGLVGGIGAGKTTVAALFADLGARVLCADAIVHRELARRSVRARIAAALGAALPLEAAGFKSALAALIFTRPRARRAVERILHPLVKDRIRRALGDGPRRGVVVLDVPLLVEARMDACCDALAFVHAPAAVRAARAAKSRGWSPGELRARERCQAPLAEKRARCGFRIDNGRGRAATRRQVKAIWQELTKHLA